jgi:mannose-6-phosphate isomerase-like protein (cupin superfamily)
MLIRKLSECPEIAAGDHTRLKELLHPGREYEFTARYSLAYARVAVGARSVPHRLKSDEVYYIVSGHGVMHVGDEAASVEAGDAVDIPPDSIQWIENTGSEELTFLCIVDPAWQAGDEEILG